jgi:hypothetical protein
MGFLPYFELGDRAGLAVLVQVSAGSVQFVTTRITKFPWKMGESGDDQPDCRDTFFLV